MASAVADAALHHDGDRDAQEEMVGHLSFAAEEVATGVISFFVAAAGGAETFDADKVEALIEKPARGSPVWHEQPSLLKALEIWTTDLYQDLNNGLAVYGMPKWNGIDDLVRTVRDCVELSAWLSDRPLPPHPEDGE